VRQVEIPFVDTRSSFFWIYDPAYHYRSRYSTQCCEMQTLCTSLMPHVPRSENSWIPRHPA
jgi:hypothetical protein